jgi:hypothetical protein
MLEELNRVYLICLVVLLPICGASGSTLSKIYLKERESVVYFGNNSFHVEISRKDGNLRAIVPKGQNLISGDRPHIDFRVDSEWVMDQNESTLLSLSLDEQENFSTLKLVQMVGPRSVKRPIYELTTYLKLYRDEVRLDSWATVEWKSRPSSLIPRRKFEGFLFRLPELRLGNPSNCVINVPGPFFPATFLQRDTPYTSLVDRKIQFHSSPDAGLGILSLTNSKLGLTLATWMNTGGEVSYRPMINGDGTRISLENRDLRFQWIKGMERVQSDTNTVQIVKGGLSEALPAYREMVSRTMPINRSTPAWVREMIILEVQPQYFKNGLKGLTDRIPFYREIGFNTIYLMPHWIGGYSAIDLFEVNRRIGTVEDLKEMVRTAHLHGMRVLFDMVIHGMDRRSPVVKQRPEIFIKDEWGRLAFHPTWRSVSTDWSSLDYTDYLKQLVRHDLSTYGIDGYRVDAASFKGPNWDPEISIPAYRSGADSPALLQKVLDEMRLIKSDSILLSEVFGPVFYKVSNLVHDNQAEAVAILLEQMEKGLYTAKDYKLHMQDVLDALPEGANRVYYARNHDTSWFYRFNGYTERFLNMDAIHAIFAIPEVFAGDRRFGPSPDSESRVYDFYKKIFALRKPFPEIFRGRVLLKDVDSENRWVYTGLRGSEQSRVLSAISLSEKQEVVKIRLKSRFKTNVVQLFDPIKEERVEIKTDGKNLKLRMRPFQILVGRV